MSLLEARLVSVLLATLLAYVALPVSLGVIWVLSLIGFLVRRLFSRYPRVALWLFFLMMLETGFDLSPTIKNKMTEFLAWIAYLIVRQIHATVGYFIEARAPV